MADPIDSFFSRVRKAEKFRIKTEDLTSQNLLSDQQLNYVYEVVFLSIFVGFENFIEEQFVAIMAGRIEPKGCKFSRRVNFNSSQTARKTLYQNRSHIDLLPYEQLKKVSKIYFRGGRPFTTLQDPQKQYLKLMHSMRNQIAHRSRGSQKLFESQCQLYLRRTVKFKSPSQYLRSSFSTRENRFSNDLGTLMSIAQTLAE